MRRWGLQVADDLVQRLEELASLRAQGLVSEAEFTERKAALLAGTMSEEPIAAQPSPSEPEAIVPSRQSPLNAFEPRRIGGVELAAPLEGREDAEGSTPPGPGDSGPTVVVPLPFERLPDPFANQPVPPSPPPPPPPVGLGAGLALPPSSTEAEPYPMIFEVEYAERLSRLKTFFRIVLVLPAWVFIVVSGYVFYGAVFAGWTAVFWRKRYPSWLFSAAAGYLAYASRVGAYGALLTDRFPSLEPSESPVRLEFSTPPDRRLSRWRVILWKSVLILPHLFVLQFVALGVYVVVILSWFAILFTGRYPRGMFSFVEGALRWQFRLAGYFLSFNDRFPPYSLSATAGPASQGTTVTSGILGFIGGSVMAVLIGVAIAVANDPQVVDADYAQLQQGRGTETLTFTDTAADIIEFQLVRIYDPGSQKVPEARAGRGERVVVFEWLIDNEQRTAFPVDLLDFNLKASNGDATLSYRPRVVLVNSENVPEVIDAESTNGVILVAFIVPSQAEVVSVRVRPSFTGPGGVEYRFE